MGIQASSAERTSMGRLLSQLDQSSTVLFYPHQHFSEERDKKKKKIKRRNDLAYITPKVQSARVKNNQWGTSPVVQWLRIHRLMQGMWVQFLVGELRSHVPRGN